MPSGNGSGSELAGFHFVFIFLLFVWFKLKSLIIILD